MAQLDRTFSIISRLVLTTTCAQTSPRCPHNNYVTLINITSLYTCNCDFYFYLHFFLNQDRNHSAERLGYGLEDPGFDSNHVHGFCLFSTPALTHSHQSLFYRGVKFTTHFQLAPRLRTHGVIPPLGHTSSARYICCAINHSEDTTFILRGDMGCSDADGIRYQ